MEKRPEQSITSWIGGMKTQAYLIKDIGIKLPGLFIIVVLTSGLPPDYESIIVALDAVKPDELTLELATSHLLNEEECHLSHRQLYDYKVLLVKNRSDSSVNTPFVAHSRVNVTCFNCGKKGHYAKDCAEHANLVEDIPDSAW
jgi:hypothetical protein